MRFRLLLASIIIALLALGAFLFLQPGAEVDVRASVISPVDAAPSMEGFARATDPTALTFPDAFGPHPDYQTEWWYYTGNVQTAGGRPFGYQFTIFRRSLVPDMPARDSNFAAQSVYMAHFALTDGGAGDFYAFERFQRGAGGAAGAQAQPYHVWLDDWSVQEMGQDSYQMRASSDGVVIDFRLHALKPPALHGDRGLSQKSQEIGNASYYYSQTRLETTGTITVGNQSFDVSGFSWKDHEYGTSALAENAVGWDWFSLQLSDGRELMYFQIRTEDGGIEPASSGSLVLEDATVRPLSHQDVRLEVLDTWTSPNTGGVYPSRWRLSIPSEGIELTIQPLIPNQELELSTVYWEGSVTAEGTAGGLPITARGYIELTGYAGDRAPSI